MHESKIQSFIRVTHENIKMNQKSGSYEAAGGKPTKEILKFNSCSEV